MLEALQRIVDADRIEEGQGLRLAGAMVPFAIGDLVADMGELRGGEVQRQFGGGDAVAAEVVARFDDIGVGDFLGGALDLDRRLVVAHEVAELLDEVAAEMVGWVTVVV